MNQRPAIRRRLAASAALAAVVVAALSAAAPAGARPIDTPAAKSSAISLKGVTLRIGGQTDGLRSLLVASGTLKGKAYAIQWSNFSAGPALVEALQANKIDLGGVGNTPPIFGAAARANFRIVAAIRNRKNTGDFILVPSGSSIQSLQDLKGKRIAYTRGSSGHGYLVQALARAGLKTSDVKLADLTPGDSLAAFNSGSVDAWATWEPFVSIIGSRARILPAGSGYAADGLNFVVANTALLSNVKRRTALRDYLVRFRRAIAWGVANQNAWALAFNKESGLPVDIAKRALTSGGNVFVVQALGSIISEEQKLANALAKAGVIRQVNITQLTSNQLAK